MFYGNTKAAKPSNNLRGTTTCTRRVQTPLLPRTF